MRLVRSLRRARRRNHHRAACLKLGVVLQPGLLEAIIADTALQLSIAVIEFRGIQQASAEVLAFGDAATAARMEVDHGQHAALAVEVEHRNCSHRRRHRPLADFFGEIFHERNPQVVSASGSDNFVDIGTAPET